MDKRTVEQMMRYKIYLVKKGIPKKTADEILDAFAEIARADVQSLQMDRVFTAVAFGMHTYYKDRITQADIIDCMKEIGNVIDGFDYGIESWKEVAQALKDETGITIKGEGEHFYIDYMLEELE